MPCYSPLTGWRARLRNPSGKYSITFTKSEGYADQEITVPCGLCVGCRLEHSRQWAVRCMHEASQHDRNCFVTLTYNGDAIPTIADTPTLVKRDVQLFIKRLRNKFGAGIKYYACGEYGELNSRPHYHLCLFGVDFDDKRLFQETNGNKIFTSQILEDLWSDPKTGKCYGFTTVGELTFESAAYTARYCMKKWKGKDWKKHYEVGVDIKTGEVLMRTPEFALMSRNPGIGKAWLSEFKTEVVINDSIIVRGKEMKPPKYYDTQIEKEKMDDYQQMKANRRKAVKENLIENSLARLHVRGIVKAAQIKQLKKEL